MISSTKLVVTTDGSGAGTAVSARPINGEVVEIRNNSASWGATADYTFTRDAQEGGGTVITLTNWAGPASSYPGGSVTGAGAVQNVPVPVPGYLTMTVAQATISTAGTVHVLYRT